METKTRTESSAYIYPSGNIYGGDTISIASYEEIFTLPWKKDIKDHSYISFDDSQKSNYCIDDISSPKAQYRKRKFTCRIPKHMMMMFSVFVIAVSAIILLNVFNIISFSKSTTVPELIPYEGEEWYVRREKWGMKLLNLKNCPAFKKVTKVTVTQIKIDNESCNDIKACIDYLCAYDRNVSVLYNRELEYDFFFGNDKHVFEGRDWSCPYSPGELRLGYLGNEYDPKDLGPSWGNIQYTIVQFGILNGLVVTDVCYDVDPDQRKCQ